MRLYSQKELLFLKSSKILKDADHYSLIWLVFIYQNMIRLLSTKTVELCNLIDIELQPLK